MFIRLHDYQKKAAKFLFTERFSGLFLDPGLGKTAISLTYTQLLRKYGNVKKVLIIAPKRVCQITWPDEIKKWENYSDLTWSVVHGNNKAQALKKDVDIYLINPEGLKWLSAQLDKGCIHDFDVLIIDESTKFKSWKAKRMKILIKMLRYFSRRHILTGTPAPNGLIDIFSQVYVLDRGEALGKNITRYREAYFNYDPFKYKYSLKDGCAEIIQSRIAPMILQMSADDYLDLPELIPNKIYVELTNYARDIYEDLERELFAEIEDDEVSLVNGGAKYNACRQVANGALYHQEGYFPSGEEKPKPGSRGFYDLHDEKIEALGDLVEELQGKPLLVAYNYKHDLERIKKAFPQCKVIGEGSEKDDMKLVRDWNAGKIGMLLGHPASMGHGLNMQDSGRHICWYSLTDNLENYDQFNRRIYRQGVDSNVTVHHIMAKRTVDEMIYIRNQQKGEVQDSLRDALKKYRQQKERYL